MERNFTVSKRLLFDRRYGWVIDEWKDPSEEALAGGRGMYVNVAAISTVKAVENPELLSPQVLQAGLQERLEKFTSSIQNSPFRLGFQKVTAPSVSTCSLHLLDEKIDHS
ncbi:uncharacterized protein E6C27_scaffold64G00830 [Cucumis melo var. makuwa]|uniref:Uncharacterized protein n=1 Tax=Cucumis melo var. makuwa TaxID=1194695 RepID=A0A5A7TDE2_CUCMM|nr:uncharacterized protein E6C27_scaffold64G00830 [Cucumis melo var. makuwa]